MSLYRTIFVKEQISFDPVCTIGEGSALQNDV